MVTLSVTSRGVQMKQAERQATAEEKAAAANPLLDPGRQYLIRVDRAAALLREIGILTADGKLKNDMIRKYNQIDHYVELVAPMFEQDDSEEIVLLDCACGKSYLSFVMNYYLHEVLRRRCRVIGVDINEHVIDESRAMAKRLGYHNMVFQCADLRTYQPPQGRDGRDLAARLRHCDRSGAGDGDPRPREIYRVRALLSQGAARPVHAAGTRAADQIRRVQGAVQRCADRQHARAQLEAEGYKVSVVEYISPLDTPKNLLIRAVRTGRDNPRARKEYDAVRQVVGTTSELDRRCAEMDAEFFITDDDLIL